MIRGGAFSLRGKERVHPREGMPILSLSPPEDEPEPPPVIGSIPPQSSSSRLGVPRLRPRRTPSLGRVLRSNNCLRGSAGASRNSSTHNGGSSTTTPSSSVPSNDKSRRRPGPRPTLRDLDGSRPPQLGTVRRHTCDQPALATWEDGLGSSTRCKEIRCPRSAPIGTTGLHRPAPRRRPQEGLPGTANGEDRRPLLRRRCVEHRRTSQELRLLIPGSPRPPQ